MAVIAPIVSTFDNAGVRKATKAFDKLQGAAKASFGKIAGAAKVAATAVAGIGVVGVAGALKAIDAASDLEEAISKAGVLFGDGADEIERFAEGAAKALGQSKQEAIDAAATFAIFGKSAGLAGDDLVGFSTDFVELASDLASFNNTSPEDAVQAIGAALRGESEPLRRYGVLLNDATLKAEALALGIYDGEGALTAQQKVLAAEQAIYKQTADAQGDFARTSDGLANKQRILRAQLANVTTEIGSKLLPIALQIANFFAERVIPVIEGLSAAFSEGGLGGALQYVRDLFLDNVGPATEAATGLFQKLIDFLRDTALPFILEQLGRLGQALVDWIGPRIGPALRQLLEWLQELGRFLLDTGLPWLVDKLQELGQALVDWIGPRIRPALSALGDLITRLANWLLDEGLPMLVDKLIALGDALVEWIKPRIVPALEALGEFLVAILDWLLKTALPKLAEQAYRLGAALLSWLIDLAPKAIEGLVRFLVALGDWIVTEAIPTVLGWGRDLGAKMISGIVDGIKAAASKVGDALKSIPGVSAAGKFIGAITPFADGGIVTGPTLGLVGEAGPEAVIPLDRLGRLGGGPTISVTVNGAVDPVATAKQIRQILQRDQSRLGLASAV
jgi:hypothetical protein